MDLIRKILPFSNNQNYSSNQDYLGGGTGIEELRTSLENERQAYSSSISSLAENTLLNKKEITLQTKDLLLTAEALFSVCAFQIDQIYERIIIREKSDELKKLIENLKKSTFYADVYQDTITKAELIEEPITTETSLPDIQSKAERTILKASFVAFAAMAELKDAQVHIKVAPYQLGEKHKSKKTCNYELMQRVYELESQIANLLRERAEHISVENPTNATYPEYDIIDLEAASDCIQEALSIVGGNLSDDQLALADENLKQRVTDLAKKIYEKAYSYLRESADIRRLAEC